MNARNLAQARPASLVAPIIEAQFQLELAKDEDNPLQGGGKLSTSGMTKTEAELGPGTTTCSTMLVSLDSTCRPILSLALESGGYPLLELELEVTELGNDAADLVDVCVTSRGVLPEHAECMVVATGTYAWRLTGHLARTDAHLQLAFELVQELGPVACGGPVSALGSVLLPFDASECDEPQVAHMKIKPSGTGLEVPT